jgi:nicotinate-nucleotide adenylyltransferase
VRIGVLGGTFDPVHFGHLKLAEIAARAAALDKVLFMPAHIQPFKQDARVTGDAERVEMLRLAISGNEKFEITDVELARGGVSYTIDSLRRLRAQYAASTEVTGAEEASGQTAENGIKWFFILGADMFLSLGKWRKHERLMREFAFVVGHRPGYRTAETEESARRYTEEYGAELLIAAGALPDISSTELRRRAQAGESLRGATPDAVAAYIVRRGLYRDGPDSDSRRPDPER